MGREDEGSDLWEWETPRGLFLGSQKVLRNVWVENQIDLRKRSLAVSERPFGPNSCGHPLRFKFFLRLNKALKFICPR